MELTSSSTYHVMPIGDLIEHDSDTSEADCVLRPCEHRGG
jgi:hypothetical protein